jgi:hypothetical protein
MAQTEQMAPETRAKDELLMADLDLTEPAVREMVRKTERAL